MGMACVMKGSLALVEADTHRNKESGFVHDGWWPLLLFVSCGV